jgi:parvulin-like peptidyl-prolyl isomerase
LAGQADLILGGELGWFPRGFLYDPELEQAAFALEPGQFSPIIHTPLGYHLLKVTARQPDRPLDPQMRARLGETALHAWVQARRAAAQIETPSP